ncbi:hypothetical protein Tco_0742241 [Tanacetum coccineum]
MLTDAIKQSDSYKAFINYSTGLVPPKKTKGKGSHGKKSDVTPKLVSVEVSDESDLELARRRTSSRRITKKKVSISADDNIIPEPDVALELAKSMSLAEAVKEEAARQVHATHERIVTDADPKPARRRPLGIAFRDTSSVSKKISPDPSQKLKRIQTLAAEEQLATDTMQALKASKRVSDESTVILTTSHEGTGIKPGVPNAVQGNSAAKAGVTLDWGSKNKSEYSEEETVDKEIEWVTTDEEEEMKDDDDNDRSIDIEKTNNEQETNDEFVQDDVDKEMKDAEVAESGKGDEEITDTAKVDAEKIEEVKDDNKKAKLPPSSSSLSVSSGFGNQFLNLSSDKSIVGNLKETADAEINSLLDVQIQQEIPHIQSPSILTVPVLVIPEPTILSLIPEISIVTPVTTLPPPPSVTIIPALQQQSTPIPTPPITIVALIVTMIPYPLSAIIQRVSVLEKDARELKEVDHPVTHLALLRSKIPSVVNAYIGSSLGDALQKDVIEESMQANVINEVKNLLPKFLPMALSDFATSVIQSNVKKALEKTPIVLAQSSSQAQSSLKAVESLTNYELKTILFKKMNKSRSYLTHDKHQALFNSLLNSIYLDDIVARGQADTEKIMRKRDHGDDKDEDPSPGPNQGKKTKRRRTKESESSKKTSTTKETSKGNAQTKGSKSDKSVHVEESVAETTEEVIMDASNDDVGKTVDDSQEHTWFNDLLYAKKAPLTLDELMATLIDFSKFEMNRLKIDKLTKPHLFGPIYNLLKGTCQSSNEIEYNMEECYKALSDQLDWNNPERDRCPLNLSKPLPLKGHPGHLTIASEYFFNNDLKYLKSSDLEKKHTMSITKTKAARYKLVGIKDMIPSLWSETKVSYDKDAERGIKHWGPKHQLLYRSQINKFSKDDVYSTHKILIVVSVKVNKLHGYGHLEEITVRRANRQLYTFKEGDFVDLHLNDIEDMLLLAAQHKLFQLDESDIVDLVVALCMFSLV